MKKRVRNVTVGFAAVIFLTLFSFCTAAQANCEIKAGETLNVKMMQGEKTLISFTAPVSGTYSFTSVSSCDTVAFLYDEDMTELANDDDGGDTSNFRLVCDFCKGKTYFFAVQYVAESIDLDMTVSLQLVKADESHEHTFTQSVTKIATCTQNGENTYTCICGYSYTEETDKALHDYETQVVSATCTKSGSEKSVCKNCGSTIKVTYEALGHSYSSVYTTDKNATCTAQGSKSLHCVRCGKKTDVTVISALGHAYSVSWTTDKKATTEQAGSRSHHCVRCGAKTDVTTIAKIASVKLSADAYTYNAKTKKPAVTVKDSKGTVLKNGTAYTVTYPKTSKAVGTYTVTVTFKGNYCGTVKLRFNILPKTVSSVSAKSTNSSVTLSWKKTDGAQKYRIYKYNPKTKKYAVVSDTSKTTYTLKKLKSGTQYTFAVKAIKCVDGKVYKSENSAKVTVSTVPKSVSLTAKAGSRKAVLKWKKTSCDGYIIYMYNETSGKYEQAKKIKDENITSYEKANLARGKTYYFKIRAYKTSSTKTLYSPYSKTVKITAK